MGRSLGPALRGFKIEKGQTRRRQITVSYHRLAHLAYTN
jgi:hypothetical protein